MLLFFDFGSGEIILIIMILFIVLGPKRLPEVARTLGKTINEMKRASAGFKNEINKEVQKLERETRYNEFLMEREGQKTQDKRDENLPSVVMPEGSISHEQGSYQTEQTTLKGNAENESIVEPNKTSK
jgi:Tat protein translocase TatB subunit